MFVDSGAILGSYDPRDNRYRRFLDEEIVGVSLVTSSYVVAETIRRIVKSKVDVFAGPAGERNSDLAVHFLGAWLSERNVSVIHLPEALFDQARDTFEMWRGIGWDLTDAISFVIVQGLEQNEILSPDRHFAYAGLSQLP